MAVRDTGFQPVRATSRDRRSSLCKLLLLFVFAITGCNSLPAGDPAAIASTASPSLTQPTSQVILIRGWRDLWSDGIDQLGEKLRADGLPAVVFKESQWRDVESSLAERSRIIRSPLILVGFSWGADDVILISRRLDEHGRAVDLLILIDPVTPAEIPANVKRCINFYQSNGVMDVFPWLRGVAVKDDPARVGKYPPTENVDIRDRPDLLEPGTSHKTIAGNMKVHAAIVEACGKAR